MQPIDFLSNAECICSNGKCRIIFIGGLRLIVNVAVSWWKLRFKILFTWLVYHIYKFKDFWTFINKPNYRLSEGAIYLEMYNLKYDIYYITHRTVKINLTFISFFNFFFYRHESGRCRTLVAFIIYFYNFTFPGFPLFKYFCESITVWFKN